MLDRRNRMLDHLLARQGEDTVAFGQELHRWAQTGACRADLPMSISSRNASPRGATRRMRG